MPCALPLRLQRLITHYSLAQFGQFSQVLEHNASLHQLSPPLETKGDQSVASDSLIELPRFTHLSPFLLSLDHRMRRAERWNCLLKPQALDNLLLGAIEPSSDRASTSSRPDGSPKVKDAEYRLYSD